MSPPRTIAEFLSPDSPPRVIAHRGFSGVAPENTMAAFRRAMEIGADMIELDVLLSREGEVVVLHDATLDRTTNLRGEAGERTLAEIRAADAGSWFASEFAGERVPTLAEVLELASGRTPLGRILLNVEIKRDAVGPDETPESRGGIADRVARLIAAHGMREATIVSSFNPLAIRQIKAIDPGLATAALFNEEQRASSTPSEVLRETGADGFNLADSEVTPEIVRECRAAGAPVAVYTVDDVERMRELVEMGVAAIFTNRPDRMIRLLAGTPDRD